MKAALSILAISVGLLIATNSAQAKTLKKEFCNNIQYFTNAGTNGPGTYPHLHCENTYIGYTPGRNTNTINIMDNNGLRDSAASRACEDAKQKNAGVIVAQIHAMCDAYLNTNCVNDCQ